MDVSIFLAQVLGVYLVVLSLSLLINVQNFTSVISGIFHNAALQFIIGLNLLIVGTLMVVSHNMWSMSWTVVITILAWIVFVKGVLYMAFPKAVHAIAQPLINCKMTMYVAGIVNLVLGLFLCYMGFIA